MRTNVNPEEGERIYRDVAFSDTTTNNYLDKPKLTRAAWCSIHHRENAYSFMSEYLEVVKTESASQLTNLVLT